MMGGALKIHFFLQTAYCYLSITYKFKKTLFTFHFLFFAKQSENGFLSASRRIEMTTMLDQGIRRGKLAPGVSFSTSSKPLSSLPFQWIHQLAATEISVV